MGVRVCITRLGASESGSDAAAGECLAHDVESGGVPMSEHRLELDVCAPTAQVVALLSVRPATWLRSFLRLATLEAGANTAELGLTGVTRHRLGPPALGRSGAVAS